MAMFAGLALWASPTQFDDQGLKFRISFPDGFEPADAPPNAIFSYAETDAPGRALAVTVERMRIALPQRKPKPNKNAVYAGSGMPASSTSQEEMTWRDFQIPVLRTETNVEGRSFVLLQAQIPLSPEAITVGVGGLKQREPDIRRVLEEVVGSTEGRASWLTEKEQDEEHRREQNKLAWTWFGLLVIPVVLLALYKYSTR
ncbi:MAG TPA: hypothetical protein VFA20_03430 [Myxococcaceae bacterium]|nr:hypothetical protein [Myxococcaceae bacterium]